MRIVGINKLCTRLGCRGHAGPGAPNEAVMSPLTNHHSLITNFYSQIIAFLVDTLPIRIVFSSFRISARAIYNRHSLETLYRSNFAGVNL